MLLRVALTKFALLLGCLATQALAHPNGALRGLAGDNKNEDLANNNNKEEFDEDRELTNCGTPLTCVPKLVLASNEQALCNPETNYYFAAPGEACLVDFPSVLILTGLQACQSSIGSIKFVLSHNGADIRTWQDKYYPYTVFSNVPGSFQAETLLPGSYSLSILVRDPNRCEIWSGVITFTISDQLCNNDAFCAATTSYGGHKYKLIQQLMPWQQAVCYATTLPMCCGKIAHLATVADSGENAVVKALASPNYWGGWMGGSDLAVEGTFTWITGEPFSFTNFAPGQPDNSLGIEDCLHWWTAANGWNDVLCSNNFASIVEYECE